jgi:hypothetical protein
LWTAAVRCRFVHCVCRVVSARSHTDVMSCRHADACDPRDRGASARRRVRFKHLLPLRAISWALHAQVQHSQGV